MSCVRLPGCDGRSDCVVAIVRYELEASALPGLSYCIKSIAQKKSLQEVSIHEYDVCLRERPERSSHGLLVPCDTAIAIYYDYHVPRYVDGGFETCMEGQPLLCPVTAMSGPYCKDDTGM